MVQIADNDFYNIISPDFGVHDVIFSYLLVYLTNVLLKLT